MDWMEKIPAQKNKKTAGGSSGLLKKANFIEKLSIPDLFPRLVPHSE